MDETIITIVTAILAVLTTYAGVYFTVVKKLMNEASDVLRASSALADTVIAAFDDGALSGQELTDIRKKALEAIKEAKEFVDVAKTELDGLISK